MVFRNLYAPGCWVMQFSSAKLQSLIILRNIFSAQFDLLKLRHELGKYTVHRWILKSNKAHKFSGGTRRAVRFPSELDSDSKISIFVHYRKTESCVSISTNMRKGGVKFLRQITACINNSIYFNHSFLGGQQSFNSAITFNNTIRHWKAAEIRLTSPVIT